MNMTASSAGSLPEPFFVGAFNGTNFNVEMAMNAFQASSLRDMKKGTSCLCKYADKAQRPKWHFNQRPKFIVLHRLHLSTSVDPAGLSKGKLYDCLH